MAADPAVRAGGGAARVTRARRASATLLIVVGVIGAVACQPVSLGFRGATFGHDVTAFTNPATPRCAQFQATTACGATTAWAAINGPYEPHANGDPYASKCATATGMGSAALCDDASTPNGAKNPTYRKTGYDYAIDVSDADADAGLPLVVQVYDVGSYARSIGTAKTNDTASIAAGSNIISISPLSVQFVPADVGSSITGEGIPAGATITQRLASFQARISVPATSTGTGRTISWTPDCRPDAAPFTGAFPANFTTQTCQTGDSGGGVDRSGLNMDVLVYDNDDDDATVDVVTPLSPCHLQVLASTPNTAATYKNRWAAICTIEHPRRGIYPVRVRSSGLPGVVDSGTGINAFALAVQGGSSTRLYALGDASFWLNSLPESAHHLDLADIPTGLAGKKLRFDLYDLGDGFGNAPFYVRITGPGGVGLPAAGVASSCTYNATKSTTKGPPATDPADNCRVMTYDGTGGPARYNDGWARIEVQLDPAYHCGPSVGGDCWWTLSYSLGAGGILNDRFVFSLEVV